MKREIKIPKFLNEIHGNTPTITGLTLTYVVGILTGLIAGLVFLYSGFELWRAVIVGILFADVAGGVVSNLTRSTNTYYQRPKGQRLVFLCLHLIQPLLLALLLDAHWSYLIFIALFTVVGGLTVNAIKTIDVQYVVAASLITIGIVLSTVFNVESGLVFAFGTLFMIKIILGFAVRRP